MRRHSRQLFVAELLALAVTGMTFAPAAVAQPGPPGFGTDHFLCYEATESNPNTPITISLDDQFCAEEDPEGRFCLANVSAMTALEFCNPTSKDVFGHPPVDIEEPNAHLTFYELTQKLPAARTKVVVENQFGRQTLRVAAPRLVAVPTLKNGEGDEGDLGDINHFTCYEASGKRVLVEADVEDQFRPDAPLTILVHSPHFLCNPTVKSRGSEESPVPDENDHLVCYKVTPSENPPGTTSVSVENQFEGFVADEAGDTFQIGPLHFLCAPSHKLGCTPAIGDCPEPPPTP